MRLSTKVFFALLSLLALAYVGVTTYGMWHLWWYESWPFPMNPHGNMEEMAIFYGIAALAAVTALLALGLLIRALTVRRRRRDLLLKDGDGEVRITEEAVESGVRGSLAQFGDIQECDVRLSMQQRGTPGNIIVKVRAGVREKATLEPVTEMIQEKLKRDIELLTGATVAQVDVTFYEVRQMQRAQHPQTAQRGR